MSASNNQSWGNGQVGIFTLLLVIFLIWAFSARGHFFHNTGRDIKTTLQDAGHDLKSTGRDAAASIRDTVQ
jgi:hypothetical protein